MAAFQLTPEGRNSTTGLQLKRVNVWFSGRMVAQVDAVLGPMPSSLVLNDRVGQAGNWALIFCRNGDEMASTATDRDKFGTYEWDGSTGLDYAQNRYYTSYYGRFMTPDPYTGSADPHSPESWNRYAYAGNDPIDNNDPTGLFDSEGGDDGCYYNGMWVEGCDLPMPSPNLWFGPITQGGQGQRGELTIRGFATTGIRAQVVQNDLRWVQSQISQYPDCDSWLSGNGSVIDMLLGQAPQGGTATDIVGVGSFSDHTVNAIAGTAGTNLDPGIAGMVINLNGAFFNSSASTGYSGINAGSNQAQLFILLHELAHDTGAAGFADNDSGAAIQNQNNQLLMQKCGSFIQSVSNKP